MDHKQFNPYDKVLVRNTQEVWVPDIYSYWSDIYKKHVTTGFGFSDDDDIISFEGNEHLAGTHPESFEECIVKDGDWGFATNENKNAIKPHRVDLVQFHDVSCGHIRSKNGRHYNYFIPFDAFDPDDIEESLKHLIGVHRNKAVKYKK